MKRFEFKLDALLNYKRHLEQVARREMADAQTAVTSCQQRIHDLGEDRTLSVNQLESRVAQGIMASEFQGHQTFIAGVEQMIETELMNLAALEGKVEEKRAVLKQRTMDKKAIERLREKRVQEHIQEMLKFEQKELDEICAIKTAREGLNENT